MSNRFGLKASCCDFCPPKADSQDDGHLTPDKGESRHAVARGRLKRRDPSSTIFEGYFHGYKQCAFYVSRKCRRYDSRRRRMSEAFEKTTSSVGANGSFAARPWSNSKNYPSKFIPSLSGNQSNTAGRSQSVDSRQDSQAIDPLSHVREPTFRVRIARHAYVSSMNSISSSVLTHKMWLQRRSAVARLQKKIQLPRQAHQPR